MRIKKGIVFLLVLAMMATFAVGCGDSNQPGNDGEAPDQGKVETQFLNIATGGTAGTYFPLGGAIMEILNKDIEGMNASAAATGASVANTNQLNTGEADLAFIQNDISFYAVTGTEMFTDNKIDSLRAISTIYPETCQLVTLDKYGVKSVADLKGKKVAVGDKGSGVEANARQILNAYGITYNDIKVQYLSFAEAANGLKDGNIDAAFITAGFPTAAIQDISAQHNVVLISIDDAIRDALIAEYPFYTKMTIPAGAYPKQDADVEAIAVKAMLVVTDKMSDDTAYAITKAIYSNLDRLGLAHPVGKTITKEAAKEGMSIPLHPGAERYFNE